MAHYRIYLSDADNYVQDAVGLDCASDEDAIRGAQALIKDGGQVDLWTDDLPGGPLVGSFRLHPGPMCAALVRRSRRRIH